VITRIGQEGKTGGEKRGMTERRGEGDVKEREEE